MTPRTLFIIILRVLGILILKELLVAVPQLIYTVMSFSLDYSDFGAVMVLLFSVLTVAVIVWLGYMLIFKAEMLVTRFGLDKGFSEEVLQLNINTASILRIALIVTGGLILIPEIPRFCRSIYNILRQHSLSFVDDESSDWSPVIVSGVKIVLGLLLIGERKRILEFLQRSPGKENEQPNESV